MDRPAAWRALAIDLEEERPFHIGGAAIDPVSRDANFAGRCERLQPQTLKVLIALVRRKGQVVTRSELVDSCWNGRIVGEDVINRSISLLRDFAERAGGFAIETVPKAGYRLVETGVVRSLRLEAVKPHWQRKSAIFAALVAVAGGGLLYNMRSAPAEPPRIAVLPFDATGVEPALAQGMSDELLSQLSRRSELRVIGRTSSNQFNGKAEDLRSIGRKLNAQYIVEGSVRTSRDQLHVAVSLVRAKDGSALWARTFKGSADTLQPIQAAIGSQIGQSLGLPPVAVKKSTKDGEAYALYLRAKGLIRKRDEDSLRRAQDLLQEAVRIDPGFAGAWAQLAIASTLMTDEGLVQRDGSRLGKREAAKRAVALDPNLAEAHAALAAALDWNLGPSARGHLRRALELQPNDPQIMYWWGLALVNTGDVERANRIVEKAAALDPLWQRPVSAAAVAAVQAGNRRKAESFLRAIGAGNPQGAKEVEIDMAHASGDYSRVIELSLSDRKAPWSSAKFTGIRTLIGLGFINEAILISGLGPTARQTLRGHAPPIDVILEKVRRDVADGDDLPIFSVMTWELSRERRWRDIAALYDSGLGQFGLLKSDDPGGRLTRATFGAYVALALKKAGRHHDAIVVARKADEAARFVLAHSPPDGELLASIAGLDAILGRRDLAITHLEQSFRTGWRMFGFEPGMLDEHSIFATLRGDPRFERLRLVQEAHIAKERREVEALGIF